MTAAMDNNQIKTLIKANWKPKWWGSMDCDRCSNGRGPGGSPCDACQRWPYWIRDYKAGRLKMTVRLESLETEALEWLAATDGWEVTMTGEQARAMATEILKSRATQSTEALDLERDFFKMTPSEISAAMQGWNGPGEKPHEYSPDYMAMGDCRICGHTRDVHYDKCAQCGYRKYPNDGCRCNGRLQEPVAWVWLAADGRVRSASNTAPDAQHLAHAAADGDRIIPVCAAGAVTEAQIDAAAVALSKCIYKQTEGEWQPNIRQADELARAALNAALRILAGAQS